MNRAVHVFSTTVLMLLVGIAVASCSQVPRVPSQNPEGSRKDPGRPRVDPNSTGTTYYVSARGSDEHAGTSPGAAWRTLRRASQATFGPGDRLLLEGGRSHFGTLWFRQPRCGATPEHPLRIESYGTARAVIDAGAATGIYILNCGSIEIADLSIVGEGTATSDGHGIFFFVDRPASDLAHIVIDGVDVTGFRKGGITIGSWVRGTGYRGVSVTNSVIHDNGEHGIQVFGFFKPGQSDYSHERVRVSGNCVHHNQGDPSDEKRHHTGNGIVIGSVRDALIEYNVAHHNGGHNVGGERDNGPVGIWAWDSDSVVMQFNESHHNRSATLDGGGFDFDGGVSNSLMQYNYSHDNDGPGFLIAQSHGVRANENNTIRYNISQDDGRRAGQAGIMLWNDGDVVRGVQIFNNSVFVGDGAEARPAAFKVAGDGHWEVAVRNNLFFASGDADLISNVADSGEIVFQGNAYVAPEGRFRIRDSGVNYSGLRDWRLARGQEQLGGRLLGLARRLAVSNEGGDGTGVGPSTETFSSFSKASWLDAGLDLFMRFGIRPGNRDFHGNRLPMGAGFAIGAEERNLSTPHRRHPLRPRAGSRTEEDVPGNLIDPCRSDARFATH